MYITSLPTIKMKIPLMLPRTYGGKFSAPWHKLIYSNWMRLNPVQDVTVAYKVLYKQWGKQWLVSPVYPCEWVDNRLEVPKENLSYMRDDKTYYQVGIHCLKYPFDPEIHDYAVLGIDKSLIVQLRISGTVVEGEHGYRVQRAKITALIELEG